MHCTPVSCNVGGHHAPISAHRLAGLLAVAVQAHSAAEIDAVIRRVRGCDLTGPSVHTPSALALAELLDSGSVVRDTAPDGTPVYSPRDHVREGDHVVRRDRLGTGVVDKVRYVPELRARIAAVSYEGDRVDKYVPLPSLLPVLPGATGFAVHGRDTAHGAHAWLIVEPGPLPYATAHAAARKAHATGAYTDVALVCGSQRTPIGELHEPRWRLVTADVPAPLWNTGTHPEFTDRAHALREWRAHNLATGNPHQPHTVWLLIRDDHDGQGWQVDKDPYRSYTHDGHGTPPERPVW